MKNAHKLAALLLLCAPPAYGGPAHRPADFGGGAKSAAQNANRREAAREPGQVILVTVDGDRKVFLGKEQAGTTDDVGPLRKKLRQAIERNRRAARDRGDEEAAAAVFICAPHDLRYGDVVKVVDAIREAGGRPIGLETDCAPPR